MAEAVTEKQRDLLRQAGKALRSGDFERMVELLEESRKYKEKKK